MMKKIIFLGVLLLASFAVLARDYETIDIGGGVIKWSTDGGSTDCGCQASSAGSSDRIFVNHAYTFPVDYFLSGFPSSNQIKSEIYIFTSVTDSVVFEGNLGLAKKMEIRNSWVIFEGGEFELIGSWFNNNVAILVDNGSKIEFRGDIKGGSLFFGAHGEIAVRNSVLKIPNPSRVYRINFITITPIIEIASGVLFEEADLEIREILTTPIPSGVNFEESKITLVAGSQADFMSGVVFDGCEIGIQGGAIGNFEDCLIQRVSGFNGQKSNLVVSGLFNGINTTIITDADITINSTGAIDLSQSVNCNFSGSKIGRTNADQLLVCGEVYQPSEESINIWDGNSWSQGYAPDNVTIKAEILGNYSSGSNGSFICGNLVVGPTYELVIDTYTSVTVAAYFNNEGKVTIQDKGSLIIYDDLEYFHNGIIELSVKGKLSSVKYDVFSTPMSGGDNILSTFPNTNPCDMYAFAAEEQAWKYDYAIGKEINCLGNVYVIDTNQVIPGADGFMNPGRGYFIPGNDSSDVREFRGAINRGRLLVPVGTTNWGNNPDWGGDDWNLIGNPYPAGLDLVKFWLANAVDVHALTDGMYAWIEQNEPPYDQFGSYIVWNLSGGTYSPSLPTEISILPAGMGAWVVANDVNNDGSSFYNLEFLTSMQTTVNPETFASKSYNYLDDERHRMWINLTNDTFQYDQILIATHPLATDSIDEIFDAHKNYGGEPVGLATVNNGQYFTIQGYAHRVEVDTTMIELALFTTIDRTHYLTIDSSIYYLDEKRVFLMDMEKGTEVEMLLGQPQELALDSAGNYKGRFFLKITNSHITSVKDVADGLNGRIWSHGNEVFYDSFRNDVTEITVFDLRGVQVYQSFPNDRNSRFTLGKSTEGVFIVTLKDKSGNQRVERIFLTK